MTPSPSAPPPSSTSEANPAIFAALRIFGLVVLVLMIVAIGYAGWIALANWGAIRV